MPPLALIRSSHRILLAAALILTASACESSPTEPATDPGASMTVDASSNTAWALVDLTTPAQLVQAADPTASTAWDLGFQTTKLVLNGGAAGPAGMVAYCVCQNTAVTTEQLKVMTPESELADFETVTKAQIPAAGDVWSADVLDQKRWYRYNITGSDHQVWPTFDVYLVKRGDEVYKVQVTGYYGADGKPRQISFRYAKLAG